MWYTNKGKGGERKKNIANTYVRRHLDQIAVHLFSKWVSPTFGYYSTTIIAINFLKFFSQILKQIFLLNFFKYIFYFAFGFTLHLLQIHVRTGCFTFFYIKKLYFENYSFPACVAWTGCHNFAIISANYKRAHVLLHFFGFLRYVLCFYISAIKLYAISIFFAVGNCHSIHCELGCGCHIFVTCENCGHFACAFIALNTVEWLTVTLARYCMQHIAAALTIYLAPIRFTSLRHASAQSTMQRSARRLTWSLCDSLCSR